jgi:D-xylose transport system ATP-binding protein
MTAEERQMTDTAAPSRPAPSTAGAPLVEMRKINVAFGGVHAVRDVSIDLHPGEVVGLVGGNGAGKSTLTKVLSGAQRPDSGEILINGEALDISNPRVAKAAGIETIYQTLALADNVDAAANMFLGREVTTRFGTLDDSAMEDATRKMMKRLNPNFRNFKSPVVSLSGGQRQSVAIARSLLGKPRVLLLDEPTAALGVAQTAQVLNLIRTLRDQGLAVVVISHNLADVFQVADTIVVLRLGRQVGVLDAKQTSSGEVVTAITGADAGDEQPAEVRAS